MYPGYGLTEQGVKDVCKRLNETGGTDRQSGSGAPRRARTEENVEAVRSVMEGDRDATRGDAIKATGLSRSTVRRILRQDLELKPLRKIKGQRVKAANAEKRLELCRKWDAQIASGELDLTKIFFTDEKLFRLGACPGGNNNLVVYVKKDVKKSEVSNDLILRDDGTWQGGISVMVALGVCYKGVGAMRFAPAGTKINSEEYLEIVRNTYLPNCIRFYGIQPDCVFQQDGASSHTSAVVQEFCAEKFRNSWKKEDWPANSPDLNVLDYFVWGYVQSLVDKKKPKCMDSLRLAIEESVESIPLDMLQRAIMGFATRVKKCIQAEGGVFKDRDLRPVSEVAVDVSSESGDEAGAGAASSGMIEWL